MRQYHQNEVIHDDSSRTALHFTSAMDLMSHAARVLPKLLQRDPRDCLKPNGSLGGTYKEKCES